MAKGDDTPDLPKLAAPALRALKGAGLASLTKLSRANEADVAALHGVGPDALRTLKAAMLARGLTFGRR